MERAWISCFMDLVNVVMRNKKRNEGRGLYDGDYITELI